MFDILLALACTATGALNWEATGTDYDNNKIMELNDILTVTLIETVHVVHM